MVRASGAQEVAGMLECITRDDPGLCYYCRKPATPGSQGEARSEGAKRRSPGSRDSTGAANKAPIAATRPNAADGQQTRAVAARRSLSPMRVDLTEDDPEDTSGSESSQRLGEGRVAYLNRCLQTAIRRGERQRLRRQKTGRWA